MGPNDDQLLVLERHSSFNTGIHLVDLDAGDCSLLTDGRDEDVRYKSITWGPDGESLYLITDKGSEWLYVARPDLTSLEFRFVTVAIHAGSECRRATDRDRRFRELPAREASVTGRYHHDSNT